jgi:PKD domain
VSFRSALAALAALLILPASAGAAPKWLAPVKLGAEVTNTSSIGRVAVAPNGTAVAAWSQATSGGFVVQVRRRLPGRSFGPVLTVPGSTNADSVDVGIDAGGNATVSWEQGGVIRAAQLPIGGSLGTSQPIASGGSEPVIAVGRSGRAVVAWIEGLSSPAPFVRSAVRPGRTGAFQDVRTISALGFALGISGLKATVGDNNAAAVIWSRDDGSGRNVVEVNDRAPNGTFSSMGTAISDLTPGNNAVHPAVTVDPTGRETALWEDVSRGDVLYAERPPGGDWSSFDEASLTPVGEIAAAPAAAVAPDGTVVAAWAVSSAGANIIQSAARAPGGGGFAGHARLSGPSMGALLPIVAVGRRGHAVIAWTPLNQEAVYNRYRSPSGAFGPVLSAVSNRNQPAGEFRNFFEADVDVDDEGNAVAVWTRDAFRQSTTSDHYEMQFAGLDAAPPTLAAVSVPAAGTVGAGIGMAAAAIDRWSPVGIRWRFGDGAAAVGGAVTHAFRGPGAFNVQVTATDAADNASSATRSVLVTSPRPVVVPPPVVPPRTPRIDSTVRSGWAYDRKTGRKFYLLRLKVVDAPRGSAAQLRCSGKGCRFQSRRFTKQRKGDITLYKNVKPAKVVKMRSRRFRAGQTVQLRVTAPGYVGKIVDYKLRRRKLPVGDVRCLAPGARRPHRC